MNKYKRGDQEWFESKDIQTSFLNYKYFDYEENPYQKFRLNTIFCSLTKVIDSFEDKKLSILDVGCATGTLLKKVKEVYPLSSVAGIDLVLSNIETASKEVDGIFFHGDIRNYIDETKTNNNIQIFSDILYYLDNKDQVEVITKMTKTLNNSGFIVIISRVSDADDNNYNSIDDLQEILNGCGLNPHVNQFWLSQPYTFVARAGAYIERNFLKKTGQSMLDIQRSSPVYLYLLMPLKKCFRFFLLISVTLTKLTLNHSWLRKYATNYVIVAKKEPQKFNQIES